MELGSLFLVTFIAATMGTVVGIHIVALLYPPDNEE